MAELDPATVRAVRDEISRRKAAEKEEASVRSAERRKKLQQSSGRQTRATVKARKVATIETAQARAASRTQEREAAAAIKLQTSAQNRAARRQEEAALKPSRTQRYVSSAQGAVAQKAISTATPSGDSNLIMVTIFIMAGLIVVYKLVSFPETTANWLNGLGNFMHAFSSNAPLFTQLAGAETTTTAAKSTAPTTQGK